MVEKVIIFLFFTLFSIFPFPTLYLMIYSWKCGQLHYMSRRWDFAKKEICMTVSLSGIIVVYATKISSSFERALITKSFNKKPYKKIRDEGIRELYSYLCMHMLHPPKWLRIQPNGSKSMALEWTDDKAKKWPVIDNIGEKYSLARMKLWEVNFVRVKWTYSPLIFGALTNFNGTKPLDCYCRSCVRTGCVNC